MPGVDVVLKFKVGDDTVAVKVVQLWGRNISGRGFYLNVIAIL